MLKVIAIGRLTSDVELKNSNNANYTGFNLAVNEGYGENAYTEYLQCILFDIAAERFIKAGAKKGSLIWIEGRLKLRTFTRKSDNSQDKCMNVQVTDWGYVPSSANKESKPEESVKVNQKEKEFTNFVETTITEDELPF